MVYRWLSDDEILEKVNPRCREHGWAELNVNPVQPTCRVLGAFAEGTLMGWLTLQLFPVIGPGWVESSQRHGQTFRVLADKMQEYLHEAQARGALVICESPVTERLAQRHKMSLVTDPVYTWIGER
jgi:hypothetical protein